MTQKSKTWPLAEAREVGEDLIVLLWSGCEKIEVAGSVRRRQELVGDVELLAIPKVAPPVRLWLDRAPLDNRILELIREGILDYRLNKKGSRTFGTLNKLLVHVPSGIPIDLFSTTPEMWGLSLVVRTGSKDFNIRVMQRCKQLGLKGHAYSPIQDAKGNPLPCRTEEEVFRLLQWAYLPPEKR